MRFDNRFRIDYAARKNNDTKIMAGMFGKNGENGNAPSSNSQTTIIGSTVHVEGTFASTESMEIYGSVKGTIETTQDVFVGPEAKITANVNAKTLVIAGKIEGNVNATEKVELQGTAHVEGDITTDIISIETGAVLQGQCTTGQKRSADSDNSSDTQEESEDESSDS